MIEIPPIFPDVCRFVVSSSVGEVYEPWWSDGMLFATDGALLVAQSFPFPEDVGPGSGLHLHNKALPVRRLPDPLSVFDPAVLRLRTESVEIPAVDRWTQCLDVREDGSESHPCDKCENGKIPNDARTEVRSGQFSVGFKAYYLAMLREHGVERLNLIPGCDGMHTPAYFRLGIILGCVMPMKGDA